MKRRKPDIFQALESKNGRNYELCYADRIAAYITLDFMIAAHLSRLVTLLVVALFSLGFPYSRADDGRKGLSADGINAVLKGYIVAEERQDYDRLYSFLSRGMKERLKREVAVKGPSDYRKLRESSEARWFDFSETKRSVMDKTAAVMFNVTIEETGEQERVPVTVRLLIQDGQWRINEIQY